MLTNKNDLLFDDLALINQLGRSDRSVTMPITYGDCNNRYEAEEAVSGPSAPKRTYRDCIDN